jgi:hypothetical protein
MRRLALLVTLVAGSVTPLAARLSAQEEVRADFDSLWRYVAHNYAYFGARASDWSSVPTLYAIDLARVTTRREEVRLLERVLDELHDSHAQLTVNTGDSPRLVPSGADIWAEWNRGRAIVTQVRDNSDAQRAGIRAGAEILSLDGVPIEKALQTRIGRSIKVVDDDIRSWALRALLAGVHDRPRRIEFMSGNSMRVAELPAADQFKAPATCVAARSLAGNFGYVGFNDCLGDLATIAAFDSVLASLRNTAGLILDLRDTPSGGNTTVGRAILSRFVQTERPYQKHVLPSEERETGIRRSWLELVTPRGPFRYDRPVVVLVGRWTGSMGEGLAIGFDATRSATILGTRMAHLRGATYHLTLPRSQIGVNLPVEQLFHVNGTPREDYVPAIQVTVSDLGERGADPWMKKAIAVLKNPRR